MFWALFLLGVTGSLHCAGMCSPLAMAITARQPMFTKILYNSGRIVTYALLGAIAAQIGQFAFLYTYQSLISIALGLSIIIIVGAGISPRFFPAFITCYVQQFSTWLKIVFSKYIGKRSYQAMFFLGMLNGLLPCGVSSFALLSCLIMPDALTGFMAMLVFGLGTWPMMLGYPWAMRNLGGLLRMNFQKATFMAMIVSGILMIGHGVWKAAPYQASAVSAVHNTNMILCP